MASEARWVLTYDASSDVMEKAPPYSAEHAARVDEFRARGDLLDIGNLGDGAPEGMLAVFRTPESAEEFAIDDPYVVNQVMLGYRVQRWTLV